MIELSVIGFRSLVGQSLFFFFFHLILGFVLSPFQFVGIYSPVLFLFCCNSKRVFIQVTYISSQQDWSGQVHSLPFLSIFFFFFISGVLLSEYLSTSSLQVQIMYELLVILRVRRRRKARAKKEHKKKKKKKSASR